jgi:ABC-type multidrug transport system ATPase subunit
LNEWATFAFQNDALPEMSTEPDVHVGAAAAGGPSTTHTTGMGDGHGVLFEGDAMTIRRGRRTVLSDVTFALGRGDIVHVTGVNGSGKTSLLRVLAGLTTPRAGSLRRAGAAAFVPEKVGLAPALRCGEWLDAMRRIRGLDPFDWGGAAEESGMDRSVLDRSSASASKGILQRIALLEAVHAGPVLVLLDEPFSGLDVEGRIWLAAKVEACVSAGAAVVLTDHSGSTANVLRTTAEARLQDGRCTVVPTATSVAAPATVLVCASHPDGRRVERRTRQELSDDVLKSLLADGWHVEEVRPCQGG